jgi:hypothetical protein
MSAESDLKLALYFESRAKRAGSEVDRNRFLGIARKYRERAILKEKSETGQHRTNARVDSLTGRARKGT